MNTRVALAMGVLSLLAACDHSSGGSTTAPLPAALQPMARPVSAPADPPGAKHGMDVINAVPLGDVAGAAQSSLAARLPNPVGASPQAVQQGLNLYIKMNCAGCHGYGAGGGMGPNLKDGYWRYGGTPVAVFKSIHDGRPQGMPAWYPALPTQEIWKIVAYIQSLGGTYPADEFQASIQGDRAGENVAPETERTIAPGPRGASAVARTQGTAQNMAPQVDVTPPGGSKP